jgi:hypothetical protein
MDYQIRLKFIFYILNNLISLNQRKNEVLIFQFEDYDDLEAIQIKRTYLFDDTFHFFEFAVSDEIGVAIFFWSRDGVPIFRFCDEKLYYEYDLASKECYNIEWSVFDREEITWDLQLMKEMRDSFSTLFVKS